MRTPSESRVADAFPSHSAVSVAIGPPAAGSAATMLRCGANRVASASWRSSTAASTIQASSATHCCQAEKSRAPLAASPSMCMSCTAVAARAGRASQTLSCLSSPTDAAFSA